MLREGGYRHQPSKVQDGRKIRWSRDVPESLVTLYHVPLDSKDAARIL
jgi:hypothetical protein